MKPHCVSLGSRRRLKEKCAEKPRSQRGGRQRQVRIGISDDEEETRPVGGEVGGGGAGRVREGAGAGEEEGAGGAGGGGEGQHPLKQIVSTFFSRLANLQTTSKQRPPLPVSNV